MSSGFWGEYIFKSLGGGNEGSLKSRMSRSFHLQRTPLVWCRADGAPEKPDFLLDYPGPEGPGLMFSVRPYRPQDGNGNNSDANVHQVRKPGRKTETELSIQFIFLERSGERTIREAEGRSQEWLRY